NNHQHRFVAVLLGELTVLRHDDPSSSGEILPSWVTVRWEQHTSGGRPVLDRGVTGRAGVDRGVTGRAGVTGRVMGGCLWAAGGLLRQVCWGRLVAWGFLRCRGWVRAAE